MSADIIDIRTGRKWSEQHIERAQRVIRREDCTAPFYDLLFLDVDEDDIEAPARTPAPSART